MIGTPTYDQSAWYEPLAHGHAPVTTMPPSTLRVVAVGLNTPAMRASGLAPHTSSCACSFMHATKNAHTFISAVTHAVEPHPLATSRDTSRCVRMSACQPP